VRGAADHPASVEGQMSDHKGAGLVLDASPAASSLIADRGYDTVTGSGRNSGTEASSHAIYRAVLAKSHMPTTKPAVTSVTKPKVQGLGTHRNAL
jgi:hypothetical protein